MLLLFSSSLKDAFITEKTIIVHVFKNFQRHSESVLVSNKNILIVSVKKNHFTTNKNDGLNYFKPSSLKVLYVIINIKKWFIL